jgi:hypothetical protein
LITRINAVSETAEDARTVHSQLKHFSSRDVNIIARDLGLFLDLVKAFDMLVPRELLWNTLERFGVPLKLIPVLRAMHKSIEVLFEVGPWWNQTLTLLNHRGQTRRLIRTRTLYYIHGGSDGDLGRSGHNYEYCTLRTREDFVLTGGNPNTAGSKNVFGKQYTEFAVSDSEHADDKAILFCN